MQGKVVMILDCFLFFNELDLLEIRLNSLAPYVDGFVLCESMVTFSGMSKRLTFAENRKRFDAFNIKYVVADNKLSPHHAFHEDAWRREFYQRDFLIRSGMELVGDDDTLIVSDVDEIPDLRHWDGTEGVFKQKMYCYYLNCYTGKENWRGSIAMKKKNITDPVRLRNKRGLIPSNGSTGWHFSYIAKPDDIVRKIEAFSHQEYNTDECKSKISVNRDKLVDPFNRADVSQFVIEEPSGPKWLLENKDRYKRLFYMDK